MSGQVRSCLFLLVRIHQATVKPGIAEVLLLAYCLTLPVLAFFMFAAVVQINVCTNDCWEMFLNLTLIHLEEQLLKHSKNKTQAHGDVISRKSK